MSSEYATGTWPHGPTAFERRFGNMATRIVSAVVLIPATLFLISAGGWGMGTLLGVVALGGLFEFYSMARHAGILPASEIAIPAGTLFAFAMGVGMFNPHGHGAMEIEIARIAMAFLPILALILTGAWTVMKPKDGALVNVGVTFGGLAVVLFPLVCLSVAIGVFGMLDIVGILDVSNGPGPLSPAIELPAVLQNGTPAHTFCFVVVVLSTVWVCDSFAYFGGRLLGRHKLLPRVSPGKTWEGAVSGTLLGTVWTIASMALFFTQVNVSLSLVLGLVITISGQVGDLFESQLKRSCDVKDSSQVIPGHGGLLDRIDSFLLVFPAVAVVMLAAMWLR